jgi:hypothetical protein
MSPEIGAGGGSCQLSSRISFFAMNPDLEVNPQETKEDEHDGQVEQFLLWRF